MTTTCLWSALLSATSTVNKGSDRLILAINNDGQDQVRVTFQGLVGTAELVTLTHASIGVWDGNVGAIANTKATPVELTFGGLSGFSLAGNGAQITSDWVNFSGFTKDDHLVVIQDMNPSGNGFQSRSQGVTQTDSVYHNTTDGTSSYNQAAPNPSGWLGPSVNFNLCINAIEVQGGTGPQTIASQLINQTSPGMSGSARQIIPLSGNGSDQVRLILTNLLGAGGTITLDHVSVGIWTGTSGDTTATPVEVKFNGLSGCTLAADGAMTVSDWTDLSGFTSSDHLVVIMDVNTAGGVLAFSRPAGWTNVWNSTNGASSYNQATTPGGYTPFVGWDFFVALVEERTNAPPPPPVVRSQVVMFNNTVLMTAPANWAYPVVPAGMVSQSYPIGTSGQIEAQFQDISALLNLGFTIGGPNAPNAVQVNLSSAQILTLNSVPVLLVPAQGPNTIIVPQFAMLTASAGSTYTFGNTIEFLYGSTAESGFNMPGTDPLTLNAAQSFACALSITSSFAKNNANYANQPLYLGADVSDPTGGTKSATFALTYSVFNIATPA